MIPISLKIQGLYSYQDKQVIDFNHLIDAELFGIFGPTGSGKSSILDAIFLTLYGKCERLEGRVAGGTNYNMMNLKSNRLFLDFEFMDVEKQKYRFTLEGKRRKKNFEDIEPLVRKYYRWERSTWFPLENPNVEKIVGLTYENFRRTIIIPQGKFQEFIHLKSKPREDMLEEIFGLQKFNLGGKTKSLLLKNKQKTENTQVLLHQFDEINEELIKEKESEKEELVASQQQVEKDLVEVRATLSKLDKLKKLVEREKELKQSLAILLQEQESIKLRQEKLDRYILCLDKFKSPLQEHQNHTQQIEQSNQNLTSLKENLEKGKEELASKLKVFSQIEQNFHNRDQLKKQAEEYLEILQLIELETNIAGKEKRIAEAERYLLDLDNKLATSETDQQKQLQREDQIKSELIDEQELREVENWLHAKNSLEQELSFHQKDEEKINLRIEEAKKSKKEILNQTNLDPRQRELNVHNIVQLLETEKSSLQEREQSVQQQLREALLSKELISLSENLQQDAPCPVCGSTHHPNLRHQAHNPIDARKLDRELEQIGKSKEKLTNILPKLILLQEQSLQIHKEKQKNAAEIGIVKQKLNQHQAKFIWKNYQSDLETSIKEKSKRRQDQKKELEDIQTRIKSLRENQKDLLETKTVYQKQSESIKNQLSELRGQFHAILNKLQLLSYETEKQKSTKQILLEKERKLEDYKGLAHMYEQTQGKIKALEKNISEINGQILSEKKSLDQTAKQLARLNERLSLEVKKEGFNSLSEVRDILSQLIHIDNEKEIIRTFEQKLTENKTSLKDVQDDIGKQIFDEQAFLEAKKQELLLANELDVKRQEIGVLSQRIVQLEEKLEKKIELQKELTRLNHRNQNLKIMEGLFKGKGFVKYVSTMHLENLCADANQRFVKLTANSLSLEVDEENNFFVRDLMNDGRRRSIKTLSGGQTFQAALCLALALSDQVQKQVQAEQNFFFLDEGFGSQDKNSLQTIFQTLKSLRKEKRVVGVISHVEDLQGEIDTHLKIQLDPEKGSLVNNSWT